MWGKTQSVSPVCLQTDDPSCWLQQTESAARHLPTVALTAQPPIETQEVHVIQLRKNSPAGSSYFVFPPFSPALIFFRNGISRLMKVFFGYAEFGSLCA